MDKDQDHLNGNYQYGTLITSSSGSLVTEQIHPNSLFNQLLETHSTSSQTGNALSADFDLHPDSVSAIKITAHGTGIRGRNNYVSKITSLFNDSLVNNGQETIESNVLNQDFLGSIMWRLKDRHQAGRQLSLIGGLASRDLRMEGYLNSVNTYYSRDSLVLFADTTTERKSIVSTNNLAYGGVCMLNLAGELQ